ncbi:unnamed protein product [Amoebophrya sp. A25]|nr:unnamed protein product [Amoebophrya sp. A25]|eukprot:GSA25T00002040001.1
MDVDCEKNIAQDGGESASSSKVFNTAGGRGRLPDGCGRPAVSVACKKRESEDWVLLSQALCYAIAASCYLVGLRFAGTGHAEAKRVLLLMLRKFAMRGAAIDLAACHSMCVVALGLLMCGTGDLESFALLRSLRKQKALVTYGAWVALHMAMGLIFLGGGQYTFKIDHQRSGGLDKSLFAIACLHMAAYPRFPSSISDNRYHLQALRYFYILAASPKQ